MGLRFDWSIGAPRIAGAIGLGGIALRWPGIPAAAVALAALVVVPLGLALVRPSDPTARRALTMARAAQPVAALLLVAALSTSAGLVGGLLALPWLCVTGLIALTGALTLRAGPLPRDASAAEICGLLFIAVGGAWTIASRLGLNPLGFSDTIVLLTAVHFHYAGFALPILVARVGALRPGPPAIAVALGVVSGVPLLAMGITFSPALETAAAVIVALSGSGLATLQLTLASDERLPGWRRGLLAVSGVAFLFGMGLALIYGIGAVTGERMLGIPMMLETHGVINSLGFVVPGLVAWVGFSSRAGPVPPHTAGQPVESAPPARRPPPGDHTSA